MDWNFVRDFFRARRVRRHVARHGERYDFHGQDVIVPLVAGVGPANALLRGKYERAEAAMILKHLPPDRPVIELGGSLGVISTLIRSRLAPGTRHVVVEANPDILDICAKNAQRGSRAGDTDVVYAAYYPGGGDAVFLLGADVHSNTLEAGKGNGRRITVPAVTLERLLSRIGNPGNVTVVCDIEGAEAALFLEEHEMLDHVGMMIVELHPDAYGAWGTTEKALLSVARKRGLAEIDRMEDTVVLARQRAGKIAGNA